MATPEQSLITDEHRATIGQKSPPTQVTIKESDAHRMCDILEDRDPRYADGTGIAPTYMLAQFGGRPNRNMMPGILPGGLLTQQEWRFTRPFKIGEELTSVSQVVDIRERLGGRYGYSVLITTANDFYDKDGNHVAGSMITITQFDPKGATRQE